MPNSMDSNKGKTPSTGRTSDTKRSENLKDNERMKKDDRTGGSKPGSGMHSKGSNPGFNR